MIAPYPYAWSWAAERAQQRRARRRKWLSLAAELSAAVLLPLLLGVSAALVWRR